MRIDFHYGPHAAQENSRTNPQNSASAGGPGNVSQPGEDQAQLTGTHAQIAALAAEAAQLPEIREERVQALRAAVNSGEYHADAEKVARAMVAHMVFGPAA